MMVLNRIVLYLCYICEFFQVFCIPQSTPVISTVSLLNEGCKDCLSLFPEPSFKGLNSFEVTSDSEPIHRHNIVKPTLLFCVSCQSSTVSHSVAIVAEGEITPHEVIPQIYVSEFTFSGNIHSQNIVTIKEHEQNSEEYNVHCLLTAVCSPILVQAGIGIGVCFMVCVTVLCVVKCHRRNGGAMLTQPVDDFLTKPRTPAVLQDEYPPIDWKEERFRHRGPVVLAVDILQWEQELENPNLGPSNLSCERDQTDAESTITEEITTSL